MSGTFSSTEIGLVFNEVLYHIVKIGAMGFSVL